MANTISKRGIIILSCANWAMEVFFDNFLAVVKENGLEQNPAMMAFLEQLDQNIQGRGFVMAEVTDYFDTAPNKLSINLFYDLCMKVIARIKKQDFGDFQIGYFVRLDDFSKKIL